ncbi:MAG TPA: hypothetical protein VFC68_06630, partial [Treponemataceae bacterium]|nr:hypothetical protein [Treponemataceae bacterium]
MELQKDNVLSQITSGFLSNTDMPVLYIAIDKRQSSSIIQYLPENTIEYDLIEPDVFFSPLAPFFKCIDYLKPDKMYIKENSYFCQKESFSSWFKTKTVPKRKDMIFKEEIYYEEKRNFETVLALLNYAQDKVFFIKNAQFMSEQAIKLIEEIEKKGCKNKFVFCFDITRLAEEGINNTFFNDIVIKENY